MMDIKLSPIFFFGDTAGDTLVKKKMKASFLYWPYSV